jgi:hypothetical protein
MEQALGLTGKKLSPRECYEHWHSRILPEDVALVDESLSMMIHEGKTVQREYRWLHPDKGEVAVRSSGVRVQDASGPVMLEGYHRILAEMAGV